MSRKKLLILAILPFFVTGTNCSREEGDFDSCPPSMVRLVLDGQPLCACNADRNSDKNLSDLEKATRPMMTASDFTFTGCNADDWVPEGYFFFSPDRGYFQVPEICKIADDTNSYVSHSAVGCTECNCEDPCTPDACLERCEKTLSGCNPGSFCSTAGSCSECAAQGNGIPGVVRECGGECGGCLDGSMCVDGVCTGLVRCVVSPSGVCSEKAPTWCPAPVSAFFGGPVSGMPCSCTLQFECSNGCEGTFQTTYQGMIE